MICQFTHQPCQYIECPLWDEGRQRCLFHLAILKILAWPAAELGQWPALTRTERNILALMAQGCRNSKIADVIGIRPRAVSRYVTDIMVKLDAKNRAHAVNIGVRQGIIVPSEKHDKEKQSV